MAPLWPADWSQFVPDLLSSAIIGVAIGVVFFLWQKRSEKRHAERLALASWSTVRSRIVVGVAADLPEQPSLNHQLKNPFAELAAATDGLPLAQWSNAAPTERALQLLTSIATELPLFADSRKRLLSSVDVAIMTIDAGFLLSTDKDYLRDATMRALSEDDDSVGFAGAFMAAAGVGSQEQYDRLDAIASEAAQDESSRSVYADHVSLYQKIRSQYMELRGLVRP